ncbi:hypothetical protein IWW37_001172 [Coemansia sp. RSA 2050]|nr:hypothetical protein IWW37_001172 [Coemansia sp. RSA 2050]
MASNNGGYHDSSHNQAQFRRATGKVAMANNVAVGPPLHHQLSQQLQYAHQSPQGPPLQHPYGPTSPQYAAEQRMQPLYAPGPGSGMSHGATNSALPSPRAYQQQPQHMQQAMYFVHPTNPAYPPQPLTPSGTHYGIPGQQQQQQQLLPAQHHAPPQGPHAQVQYQGGNPAIQHQPQHQQVQRVNESLGWDQYDDGSGESLDLYSHHQRSRQQQQQQQQGPKPNPSMSNDSAIHNVSYGGAETANSSISHSSLVDDLRRMGIGSAQAASRQQAPPATRKNVSTEALRKREQELEDAYDDDDGISGVDIDVTLFPANSRQMAHIGRSEKYGSPADSAPHTTSSSPAGAPPTGKNLEPTSTTASPNAIAGVLKSTPGKPLHKPPLLQSHPHFAEKNQISPRMSPRHARSIVSDAGSRQQSAVSAGGGLAKSASMNRSRSFANASAYNDRHGMGHSPRLMSSNSLASRPRYGRPLTPGKTHVLVGPKALRLLRNQSSGSHHPSGRAKSVTASSAQLQPLPPHWSRCNKRTAPGTAYRSNSINHTRTHNGHSPNINTTTSTVVRNPVLALSGGSPRINMSRNGSPMGPQQPPQDMAGGQRLYGSTGRSGPAGTPAGVHSAATTNSNSSPVYSGRPYANDNGFDSSSDRIAGGGRPALQQYPPPQQHQQMQHQVYGAPAQLYSDPRDRNGTAPYTQMPHSGLPPPANDAYVQGPNYSLSSSGDALPNPEPGFLAPPGMRPWTSSSKSLPIVVGQHSGERDVPSSGSSSAVGIAPMINMPSAKVVGASPLAKPPPPTLASLEAYRASIRRSSDPAAQLEFAKYILEHARGMADQENSGKAAAARYEMLTSEGIKWVKKLAGGGITVHRSNIAAEAQFFLGSVYSQGIYGVVKDDVKAFSYYQQASKAQHAEANYRTAVCYEMGVGTRKDVARALQFYRKAAAQTNVPAMYKLGVILTKGLLGVAATPREGITWLKRGADNATPECPHALHELALCYESNSIPEIIPDDSYARELFIKAGRLGYVPSQVRLGQAYEYGTLGCAVDPRKSIGWYTRAAEKGDSDAELALSGWYLTGAEPFLPQNDVEAYLWARRAADRGLDKAEYAVGYYYECGIGVAQPDVHEAQAWYARAARKNNRRAISRLRELKQMGIQAAAASRMSRPRRSKEGSLF